MADSIPQTKPDDVQASIEQRFREGNDAVLDEVIKCYSPGIQRLACRLLGWDSEVEDVVQDVFIAAFTHRRRFKAASNLKTWLFSITINICRSRNRRHLLRRKFTAKRPAGHTASADTPAGSSLARELSEKVRHAARQLPPKYRDAIVLKYLEELPTGEILELLKINEKALYTRLSRARNLLKRDLAEYWETKNE